MNRKKIAIIGWADSVHIQRWALGLTERDYDIKVISLGGKPINGVETAIIPRNGKFSYITETSKAVSEIRNFSPDIVHAHYATGNAWWGIQSKIRPLVVSVWGSDVMKFPSNFITKRISKFVLNKADNICATNDVLKKVVENIYPQSKNKITITPFGVNVPPNPPDWPSDQTFKICFAKNLLPVYGPDILLKAFALAIQTMPNLKLSIAGEGEMEPLLKRMTHDLKISERVSFAGKIPYQQIYPFIESHHLMVMPSRMESFGVAALEAGACARPVIASNVGGVPEIVKNNETGLLIPVGDIQKLAEGIIKLAQEKNLSRKLGLNGYDFVSKNYSWENSLDIMSNLYSSLS